MGATDKQRLIGSLQVVGALADMYFGGGYGGGAGGGYLLGSGIQNLEGSPSGTGRQGWKGFETDLTRSLLAQGAGYGLGQLSGGGGSNILGSLGNILGGSSGSPTQPQPNPIQPSPPQQQPQAQPIAATGPSGGPMPTPALASTPVNSTDPAVLMQQAQKNWQLMKLQQMLAGQGTAV